MTFKFFPLTVQHNNNRSLKSDFIENLDIFLKVISQRFLDKILVVTTKTSSF